MSAGDRKSVFAARPASPDAWVRAPAGTESAPAKSNLYTLRGRIKVAAFGRGLTVADMLRAMLEAAFPDEQSRQP